MLAGRLSSGAQPGSTISRPIPEKTRFSRWIIGIVILVIVVMGVLFGLIYQSSAVVSTKNFSYNVPASQASNYYTLQVTNVNGPVTLVPWGQAGFLINGTITAKGLGSSTSQVNLVESNTTGNIIFEAQFPNNAAFLISQTFSVRINVFVPLSLRLAKLVVNSVNGLVHANSLNVTGASLSSQNGNLDFTCSSCGTGGFWAQTINGNVAGTFSTPIINGNYTMSSQNGNVQMTIPTSSSFKLTTSLVNGNLVPLNLVLNNQTRTSTTQITATVGTGTGNVILSTVNGEITIQGT